MENPRERGTTGIWYAAVWQDEGRPGEWVIRISATTDVDAPGREDATCRTPDEACGLLREWLARIMR